jgi:hypothetical protein
MHGAWGYPLHWSNAIKAKQAKFRTEPEIAIRGLSHAQNETLKKALADGPCLMSVLIDIERGVQGQGAPAQRRDDAHDNRGSFG